MLNNYIRIYILMLAISSAPLYGCNNNNLKETVPTETPRLVGGWSEYTNITPEEMTLFETVIKQSEDTIYHPTKVSKQIVSGINYRFQCTATPTTHTPTSHQAIIQIYSPANGNPPTITKIERIK